ncbi:DUF3068 domain-containing protein [Nocardioides glacieisoli]|uniref:DUF3068 domain-containing protein n=1 Tax=Nocardioides glacieisoli TaxID=1168730 RepID=A0A4Q2RPS8_9ACTN|nr:DUF3068 domain-containing protein [Nocardioides glacieisoli]
MLVACGDSSYCGGNIVVRKIIGWVLLALGAFLVVVGLMAALWAPGQVKRTPLDTDSVTRLSGNADKLNPATGEVENIDVQATSITKADSELSDDDVVVFVNSTCLVINDGSGEVPDCVDGEDERLVTASTDVFATDRGDAMAVNGSSYLPPSAEEKEGLVNKWPFDAEKKTYPYWDGLLGEPVDATYDGTETIDGLETYRYHVLVEDAATEILSGVEGVYSQDKYIWIDPVTGSIINQTQDELRELEDGSTILDLQLAFTDDQVSANAADADENGGTLGLLTRTVPLIGIIGGIVALLAGGFLLWAGARREKKTASA